MDDCSTFQMSLKKLYVVKTPAPWEGAGTNCRPRPPSALIVALCPCRPVCSLQVSSFPSPRTRSRTHTWATCVGACPGGWTMQEVSPTELFPFGMSLFNFRVLLFLCEWNVRNEFHRVIFQALTGLCHLSLDHEFAFGFLPCLGFWPIPLSASNFTSQYSLWWRSRLPGVTCNFEAWRDFFSGLCFLLFLKPQVSWILSLEQRWFAINPVGIIYFCL